MTKHEIRMTKEARSTKHERMALFRISCLVLISSFVLRILCHVGPCSKLDGRGLR
jgi:hypothetical protein